MLINMNALLNFGWFKNNVMCCHTWVGSKLKKSDLYLGSVHKSDAKLIRKVSEGLMAASIAITLSVWFYDLSILALIQQAYQLLAAGMAKGMARHFVVCIFFDFHSHLLFAFASLVLKELLGSKQKMSTQVKQLCHGLAACYTK